MGPQSYISGLSLLVRFVVQIHDKSNMWI